MKQAAVSHKAEKKVNVLLNVALPYAIRLWARRVAWVIFERLAKWVVRPKPRGRQLFKPHQYHRRRQIHDWGGRVLCRYLQAYSRRW